jgi:hypothetical protein
MGGCQGELIDHRARPPLFVGSIHVLLLVRGRRGTSCDAIDSPLHLLIFQWEE